MRISDWSSDVCSSDLVAQPGRVLRSGRRSRTFESCRPDQFLVWPKAWRPVLKSQGMKQWRARLALEFSVQNERRSVLSARGHEGLVLVQRYLHPEGRGVCHIATLPPPSSIAGSGEE